MKSIPSSLTLSLFDNLEAEVVPEISVDPTAEPMKECLACHQSLPNSNFSPLSRGKHGTRIMCRECERTLPHHDKWLIRKQYRENHKAQKRKARQSWHKSPEGKAARQRALEAFVAQREANLPPQKTCIECLKTFPRIFFRIAIRGCPDGRSSFCDSCFLSLTKRQRDSRLSLHKKNTDAFGSGKKYLDATLRKYGICADDYQRMLEKQAGLCAICKQRETAMYRGVSRALCVDHCHETGRVRGLLCKACNNALGFMQDNPERMESGAAYLRKHAHRKEERLP